MGLTHHDRQRSGLRSRFGAGPLKLVLWIVGGLLVLALGVVVLASVKGVIIVDTFGKEMARLPPGNLPLPSGSFVFLESDSVAVLDTRMSLPYANRRSDSLIAYRGHWVSTAAALHAQADTSLYAMLEEGRGPAHLRLMTGAISGRRLGELWLDRPARTFTLTEKH
jgi:hypothetical protein